MDRKLLNLKAGVPVDIFVKNGIDYYAEVNLRYPKSEEGKRLTLSFASANGQKVSQNIALKGGGHTPYHFDGQLDHNLDRTFGFIQLVSQEDINLELSTEEPNASFF